MARSKLKVLSGRVAPAVIVAGALALLAVAAPSRGAVAGQDPTAIEQLFIYHLNRARSDPAAWEVEHSLPVDLSSVSPQPPLALNRNLVRSARFHADEMATFDYFGHQSDETGDWPNKMARDAGYNLFSAWADDDNFIESLVAGTAYVDPLDALNLLLIDPGFTPPGHRIHLLGMDAFFGAHVEVGVGYAFGGSFGNYWAIHTGRTDVLEIFLTGVVYNDFNGNDLYDFGEGINGVTVTVGVQTATTNAYGGWSLSVASGTQTISASGGGFSGTSTASVSMGGVNHEVDFISGMPAGIVDFIVPTNTNPIAANDSGSTLQATPVTISVLLNDSDPDGDTLTITAVTNGTSGSVTDNGDGTVTYMPTGSFTGGDTFTYTIGDGNGGTATGTVTVTVTLPDLTAPTLLCTDLEISGQTNDPFAVVTVGGTGASTFGFTSFSRSLSLTGSPQTIPIVATDGAGNPTSRDVMVAP